jgi:hypothetical protein
MKAIQRVKGKKAPETVKVKKGQQLLPLEENMSPEHLNYTLAKAEHPKEYAADKKKKIMGHKRRSLFNQVYRSQTAGRPGYSTMEESMELDESFMSTYNRNENANRHTENVVHLAKHFGTKADQAQAKFFKDELKKHGHNIHHEAAYKLHEKLWPSAVAAHKVEKLEEGQDFAADAMAAKWSAEARVSQSARTLKAAKPGTPEHKRASDEARVAAKIRSFHREEVALDESILSPGTKVRIPHRGQMKTGKVVRYQPGSLHTGSPAYVVYHGETESAVVPAHKVEKLEESEQLDELKIPKAGFVERGMIGFHPRSIAGRVHQMPHHELKSLHHAYEKNPPQSMTQKQQHRSIKTALRKFGDAQGTHNYVDKSKFVKKDLKEGLMSFVQRKIAGPIEKRHAEYNNEKKKLHKSQFVKNAAGPTRLPKAISEEAHSNTFNTVKTVIREALLKPSSNWRYGKPERRKWNWPKPIAGTPPMPNDDGQGSHDNLEPASGPKKAKNQLKEAVSRKDFQMVADLIKANPNATDRQTLANHHAHVFAQQNPRFDHARFHAAAGTQYQKG